MHYKVESECLSEEQGMTRNYLAPYLQKPHKIIIKENCAKNLIDHRLFRLLQMTFSE